MPSTGEQMVFITQEMSPLSVFQYGILNKNNVPHLLPCSSPPSRRTCNILTLYALFVQLESRLLHLSEYPVALATILMEESLVNINRKARLHMISPIFETPVVTMVCLIVFHHTQLGSVYPRKQMLQRSLRIRRGSCVVKIDPPCVSVCPYVYHD